MKSIHLIKTTLCTILVATPGWAQTSSVKSAAVKASSTSVLPFTGPNLNDVALDSQVIVNGSSSSAATLDIYISCFGTNLRAVPNPIAENSQITAQMTYLTSSGEKTFQVTFPAKATMKSFASSDTNQDLTNATRVLTNNSNERLAASLQGNLIRIKLTEARTIPVDVLAVGTDFAKLTDLATKAEFLKNISFSQVVPGTNQVTQFMAFSGPVTAASNWYASENGKTLTMLASFPGENQYCGGFYSPLVLKFDGDEVPVVDKSSNFRLGTKAHKTSWPSFKEEIYFLAIDRNKNGKIDDGAELFGDINAFADGFKNLAAYDSNGDGVIDAKDPVFKDLILWRDRNHDGKSSPSEIKTLAQMGVTSISLTYDGVSQMLNENAKVIGPGEFTYQTKKGEVKKGRVWDIFLKFIP